MSNKILKISSKSVDAEAIGTWEQSETEHEMSMLGLKSSNKNIWIDFALDHAFDCELDPKIQELLIENDDVLMVKVNFHGIIYTIEKTGG